MRPGFAPVALLLSWSALLGQVPLTRSLPPDPIETAVQAAYQREFGETIEHPAIYTCRDEGHLTTTAYLRAGAATTLLSMNMSRDGRTVLRKDRSQVLLAPAGIIRVLVLLVRHPETVTEGALPLWEAAQKQINQDHADYAKSRGYSAPIVTFDNTNTTIDPSAAVGLQHGSIRVAAERQGVSTASYQMVMAIASIHGR